MVIIVGRNPATGNELIIAQRRRNIQTQYFTWFGKTAYIHGRESFYYRQRKDTINTWRRRHIHSTQLTVLAAAVAAGLLPMAAALSLFLFTSFSRSLYILLSHYKPPLQAFSSTCRGQNSLKLWHELWHNSCCHLQWGRQLPQ